MNLTNCTNKLKVKILQKLMQNNMRIRLTLGNWQIMFHLFETRYTQNKYE